MNRFLLRLKNLRLKNSFNRGHSIVVTSDHHDNNSPFRQVINIGNHTIISDEPAKVGGLDEGPSPYQLLLSGLGSCTAMTLQMYAQRKKLPLDKIEVRLSHEKVYLKDTEAVVDSAIHNETKATTAITSATHAKIDKFERIITLHGPKLTPVDRQRLLEIANKCPVHRTLENKSVVVTSLSPMHDTATVATNAADAAATTLPTPSASPKMIESQYEMMIPPRIAYIVPPANPAISTADGVAVTRILPYRSKRSVSAFVFLDHFDNEVNEQTKDIGPHPHIGLATLTYLFEGMSLHRDSTGAERIITPGAVNYMISGKGCVHSERVTPLLAQSLYPASQQDPSKKISNGLQIWIALAKEEEQREPAFFGIDAKDVPDLSHILTVQDQPSTTSAAAVKNASSVKLIIGSFAGQQAKLPIHPSLEFFKLDVIIAPQMTIQLPLPAGIEYGIYNPFALPVTLPNHHLVVKQGDFPVFNTFQQQPSSSSSSAPSFCTALANPHPAESVRVAIFGGKPLPEPRHIFWNFIATDKKLIEHAAKQWQVLDRGMFPKVVNEDNQDSLLLPPSTKPPSSPAAEKA